jgi:hypothetical protein
LRPDAGIDAAEQESGQSTEGDAHTKHNKDPFPKSEFQCIALSRNAQWDWTVSGFAGCAWGTWARELEALKRSDPIIPITTRMRNTVEILL